MRRRNVCLSIGAVALALTTACNLALGTGPRAAPHAAPGTSPAVSAPASDLAPAADAVSPDALLAEPEAPPAEASAGRGRWQPPDVERRPFPRRVERWRDLVREVLAEEWEHGTLAGPAARIDDDLILAIMQQESGGNPDALSWAGAMGLMQVMDFTFALMMAGDESLAPRIERAAFWDERSNVRAGIRYLALAMQYHEGDIYWSLASYNAGIGNARSWRLAGLYAVPPIGGFVETATYAPAIMRNYLSRRPDLSLYVPDVMPEAHVPGALELLRNARRQRTA